MTRKITPWLWFDGNAEEAVELYQSVFKDSEVRGTSRYPDDSPNMPGEVMSIHFRLFDQEFAALNAGPEFKFTEAVSFQVDCQNQEEVDYYWNALTANGGEESMCGWLKDKFGLSWQIVPKQLNELLSVPDPAKSSAVMHAMLQMQKIDVAELQRAHDNA